MTAEETRRPVASQRTMDFTSLSFTDVTRNFGRRRALNRVSLECGAGEIVALLGPNGAGKSTLLSIAATLLEPSSGRVLFGDRPADSTMRRHVGLLAHDLYLYPELTAAENLSFFASLHGITDGGRIAAALERARLTDRRDDPVYGFSRGMRQRLALERALLHDPRLVLLDEPFTGLDDASTAALVARLRDLRAASAIVLLATHDLETIDGLVDRAVMLRDGRLAALASGPGSLRERFRRAGH
ncbi:MAG TPA: heme ABC exporter ATP-binding protein CcmA [Vicinamibacterales bacterium]|nr:heme ABC exporter ATP-binding protein CcmA [Vicinamibacterales bacterium]